MEIVPLGGRPNGWDEVIRGYATKTLFHESAWLDHVASIHPRGRIQYFAVLDNGTCTGYHCGLTIRKLLLPIHGSPLGGTGTNYMGPLVAGDVDQRALLRAYAQLVGLGQFAHLELSHAMLDDNLARSEGFAIQEGVTHLVPVPNDIDDAWAALKSEARNRIRKAEQNGLVVERTDDPTVVDQFFEQFTEVYAKQGMVTPFGIERPRSLFRSLTPAGRLLPLRVRHGEDVLATGLFPFDDGSIYFWGAASWLSSQKLCPNELLHWEVIRFAVERGIAAYNMCGGTSRFKNKFGGSDVPYNTLYRSALPVLRWARDVYRRRHFRKLRRAAA